VKAFFWEPAARADLRRLDRVSAMRILFALRLTEKPYREYRDGAADIPRPHRPSDTPTAQLPNPVAPAILLAGAFSTPTEALLTRRKLGKPATATEAGPLCPREEMEHVACHPFPCHPFPA
jgi:hypothetical protein